MKKKRNWKTTVFGILTIAGAGFGAYVNPSVLNSEQGVAGLIATIMAGIGLIAAHDARKKD